MAGTKPKIRFSKVMEILLWLAGFPIRFAARPEITVLELTRMP